MIDKILEKKDIIAKFRTRNYTKNSDKYLKCCIKCRKVWEDCSRAGGSPEKVVYYDDFPTIGKPREICARCK